MKQAILRSVASHHYFYRIFFGITAFVLVLIRLATSDVVLSQHGLVFLLMLAGGFFAFMQTQNVLFGSIPTGFGFMWLSMPADGGLSGANPLSLLLATFAGILCMSFFYAYIYLVARRDFKNSDISKE